MPQHANSGYDVWPAERANLVGRQYMQQSSEDSGHRLLRVLIQSVIGEALYFPATSTTTQERPCPQEGSWLNIQGFYWRMSQWQVSAWHNQRIPDGWKENCCERQTYCFLKQFELHELFITQKERNVRQCQDPRCLPGARFVNSSFKVCSPLSCLCVYTLVCVCVCVSFCQCVACHTYNNLIKWVESFFFVELIENFLVIEDF